MRVLTCALLGIALILTACKKDETVAGYGTAEKIWTLTELDGSPFTATATLTFLEPGRIAGQAPCNRYFADMDKPYPWFGAGPIGATRMVCAAMADEARYLEALAQMTLSEVLGDTLILSNDAGRQMVFSGSPAS